MRKLAIPPAAMLCRRKLFSPYFHICPRSPGHFTLIFFCTTIYQHRVGGAGSCFACFYALLGQGHLLDRSASKLCGRRYIAPRSGLGEMRCVGFAIPAALAAVTLVCCAPFVCPSGGAVCGMPDDVRPLNADFYGGQPCAVAFFRPLSRPGYDRGGRHRIDAPLLGW